MDKTIRRGQVWYYKPSVTPSGHIQKGPRPVIIVSNDHLNQSSSVVLAVPCTSQIKRNFPTHVLFIMDKQVSVALTEQTGPVNVDELTNLKYTLDEYIMTQVDEALKISLGFKELPESRQVYASPTCQQPVNNTVDKKPLGNQVDKFYSKYPHLRPVKVSKRNDWTADKMHKFISDYEAADHLESVAANYKLSMSTLKAYYHKFKSAISGTRAEASDNGALSNKTRTC